MPRTLRYIAYSALAFTGLALAVIVFGPQEGLETLAGGLLAYFALLYHILVGLIFFAYWLSTRKVTAGFAAMSAYLLVIYGIGLYQFILINDLDSEARDFLDARADPLGYRLRELGRELHFQFLREQPVDQEGRHEWLRLAREAEDVNEEGEQGMPALWYAAAMGDLEMVEALLERGAIVDDPNLFYKSPLAAAVDNGHLNVVLRLADAGADINAGENRDRPSLTVAVLNDDMVMVETLLARGADPDLGRPTPFSLAVRRGDAALVGMLLDAGATPVLDSAELPVRLAIEEENDELLAVLLEKTDGFEARLEGRDPILFSLFFDCNLDDFVRFLELGADPNVLSNKGQPLFISLIYANSRKCDFEPVRAAMAKALIDAGADLDVTSTTGDRLAPFALWKGKDEVARLLVAADADLSGEVVKKDFLMLAAGRGLEDLVRAALKRGFDPNYHSQGMNGSNALVQAASGSHRDVLEMLIDAGGRPSAELTDLRNLYREAAKDPGTLALLLERFPVTAFNEDQRKRMRWGVNSTKNEASNDLLEAYLKG